MEAQMSDAAYRAWIQTLASCLDGKSFSEWLPEQGEWRNIACHIRRAGPFGTAFKAEFSCVPMTFNQHMYQHQKGELACLRRFSRDPQLICTLDNASPFEAERIAAEWFDAQVEIYRARWLKETPEGRAWAAIKREGVIA
jgi:hypothetical protein